MLNGIYSPSFKISFGLIQGSVLSPFLFAVYLDGLIDRRIDGRICYIFLYADGILLISSSVRELQTLLHTCEHELKWLDMTINVNKSCCMRIYRLSFRYPLLRNQHHEHHEWPLSTMGERNAVPWYFYDQLSGF